MMSTSSLPTNQPEWLGELNLVRKSLLSLHKALLEHERSRYEQARGAIESSGKLLQLLMSDPWFAWLRPLSGLIVRIDELVDDEAKTPAMAAALHAETRLLLQADENGADFQREYYRALQESSEVVGAHGEWRRVAPKAKKP